MSGDKPFDPSDMTDHRSERDAREFVDDRASATAEGTSSGPGGSKSRTPVLIGVIAAVVLIGGAIAGFLVLGGSEDAPAAESTVAAETAPEVEPAEEPVPEPEPTTEEPAPEPDPEPATVEAVPEDTPEPVISKVNETVAISYPSKVTTLTDADKKAILDLASKPLADDEQVVVSGFAGSTATEEFGRQISRERAEVIQQFLADNGIEAQIVGYGTTPVSQVLSDSQTASIQAGLADGRVSKSAADDNRLAFVSAAVVQENQ